MRNSKKKKLKATVAIISEDNLRDLVVPFLIATRVLPPDASVEWIGYTFRHDNQVELDIMETTNDTQ